MAMSKEEQKAASDRIMAKMGPLTAQERQTYDMLTKSPEDYVIPGEKRVCGICGAEFRERPPMNGSAGISALEQFSDHQAEHNPSPGKWAESHRRIQVGKEAAKGT